MNVATTTLTTPTGGPGFNIYRRKDGRFEGRISLFNPTGKRSYKAFYGKTADEVRMKMIQYRSLTMPPMAVGVGQKTFGSIYEDWFMTVSICVKESTMANYAMKAAKHILPAFRNTIVTEISEMTIYKFIAEKQEAGLSNRYIVDILIIMKTIFKYAARTYHIPNPMEGVISPRAPKPEMVLLSPEDDEKLLDLIVSQPNLTMLGIALARFTGLRIGELCALQWSNIDFGKQTLTVAHTLQRVKICDAKGGFVGSDSSTSAGVHSSTIAGDNSADSDEGVDTNSANNHRVVGQPSPVSRFNGWLAGAAEPDSVEDNTGAPPDNTEHIAEVTKSARAVKKTKVILTEPKTETSKRTIPIPKCLTEYILQFYTGNPDDFVISGKEKPLEPRTMQNRFARVLELNGLPSVHFHSLRHFFASTCIKLGFDVKALSEILGHAGVEITLNRYVHSNFEHKVEYMNRLKLK